ncbi:MAG: hypothetical protein DRN96_07945 [Thermoproteota archaeon]|nr:MAG: hypothetical protein DRN96_07945 [Candidatus Korarchaeota archaeon]
MPGCGSLWRSIAAVERYYDSTAEEEDRRLFKDAYHMLEFIVCMHYITKYLPEKARVLDVGCGSGVYAVELMKAGCSIALVDLSLKLLKLARSKVRRLKLAGRELCVAKGSSTNLMFRSSCFDAVLCFGPMYHLIHEVHRDMTAREIHRVLKHGGVAFISGISLFGVYGEVVKRWPERLLDESHREMFEKGVHRAEWYEPGSAIFTDAYFWKPLELKEYMESFGFETLELAACEGIVTHLDEQVNAISRDREKWSKLLELVMRTSNDPSIVGYTEHFIWVGRKL